MKNIKMNSKDIIITRKNLDTTITKYWRIINTENVMSKKAKANGIGSGFDLNALYNNILQMSEKRIKIKLMLNAINNGITTFNYEEEKKKHYYTIFAACEEKEKLAHLQILMKHTINPSEKAKKGLKGTGKTETFSSAKITSMINKIQLKINELDAKIAKFNDDTTIDITSESDSFEDMLSA